MLVGGLPLLVYLRTMAPTVYGLDSAELTTGAYVLGIVHAPGSPFYLIIGHLFSWLPVGDVGYRLNFMSGCTAALAISFVYLIIYQLTRLRLLAITGAWFLAFTFYFWVSAVAAELYAMQACFVAGLLLLTIKYRDNSRPRYLYLLAFLFGIGLGNHLSLILMAPGLVWLTFTGSGQLRRQPRQLVGAALYGLAGTSIYLYLPLRYLSDTPLNYARDYWAVNLATIDGLWWMVTARMFSPFIFGVPLGELPRELVILGSQLWSNFLGLGVLFGLAGLLVDFRRRPSLHTGLLLLFTAHFAFYVAYRVADKEFMFLPAYVIWALWVPLGVQLFSERVNRRLKHGWAISGSALLAFLALGGLAINFGRVDLSSDWSARLRGESIFNEVRPYGVYFGTWMDIPILEYLQIVEGRRPDVTLLFTGGGASKIVGEKLALGHPVYTSVGRLMNDDIFEFEYLDNCECYRITSRDDDCGTR